MKALLDLGEPFISLESTGDNNPTGTIPLLLLAYLHDRDLGTSLQIPDKIALLLSRGANPKAINAEGETCLHLVLRHDPHEMFCWCKDSSSTWDHVCKTKDILILMISAGADVCAIDEQGRSVSDVAIRPQLQRVWTEALKYCGIDIRDVLARPNYNPAHSTALSSEYRGPPGALASKIRLTEYLKRRTPVAERISPLKRSAIRELSSSEEDESEDDESEEHESEEHESEEHESEDDGSEDEDSIRHTAEVTETRNNKSTEENGGFHSNYEDTRARKKTKLE